MTFENQEPVKKALAEILKAEYGIEEGKIQLVSKELEKPNPQRSKIYLITSPTNPEIMIAAKYYFKYGESTDISGNEKRIPVLEAQEEEFFKLMNKKNAFTPVFYKPCTFTTEIKQPENGRPKFRMHVVYFLEGYGGSLDDVLPRLAREKGSAQTPEEKTKIENIGLDYLCRTLDIHAINDDLLLSMVTKHDGGIVDINEEALKNDIENSIFDIADFVAAAQKSKRISYKLLWEYSGRIKNIVNTKIAGIGKFKNKQPTYWALYPTHVLVKDADKTLDSNYQSDSILTASQERKAATTVTPTPYNGLAIADLTKIAITVPELGVAMLLNHPTVTELLPKEKIEYLVEHALLAREKLRRDSNLASGDIDEKYRKIFKTHFDAASRYTILRNISFISKLAKKQLEAKRCEAKEAGVFEECMGIPPEEYLRRLDVLFKTKSVYHPERFLEASVNRLTAIDPNTVSNPLYDALCSMLTLVKNI